MLVRPMLLHRMALVSVRLFCKNLGNLQEFFGEMVYRPPWLKIARTPMVIWKHITSLLFFAYSSVGTLRFVLNRVVNPVNPVNVSPAINPGPLNLTSMLVTLTPGPASVACRMWSQSGDNLRLLMNAIVASQRLTAFS